MRTFYITSLLLEDDIKKNVRDTVEAEDRDKAIDKVNSKYLSEGFEILKQKVLEL